MSDVKQALRLFSRRPAFTAALVVTLGLAIGASAAVFSLARAVLLRPLPYDEPDRLVHAWREHAGRQATHARHGILTGSDVLAWQGASASIPASTARASSQSRCAC